MNRFPTVLSRHYIKALFFGALVAGSSGLFASTATNITGLYYTGDTATGTLAAQGSADVNWHVTYASTNGGQSKNTTYMTGAGTEAGTGNDAYVVSSADLTSSSYVADTSNAQWITAPGATDPVSGDITNGGNFLPGNGIAGTGSNEGIYVYTLAFQIAGTGSGYVTSQIVISMTIAADDNYYVFVNPSGNANPGALDPSNSNAAASGTSAWGNTTQITLDNGTNGTNGNSVFYTGTNYLMIVVDNTNGINGGTSSTTTSNASGLLVYQTSAATINGTPVPEVSTWIPMLAAVVLYGAFAVSRLRASRLVPVQITTA